MKTLLNLLIFFFLALNNLVAKDIFVATIGDDISGTGTIDQPYKTIQKAAKVAVAGDVVMVRAGNYRETVIPDKSGTAGSPITFQPYNNEAVTISGTEIIKGWTLSSGSIYTASLTNSFMVANHNQSDQIFLNGQMMSIARWPNNTNPNPSYPAKAKLSAQSVSKTKDGNVTTVVFNSVENPPVTAIDAEIYVQPNNNAWSWTLTGKVTSVSGSTVTMTSYNSGGVDGNSNIYAKGSRYYLFNTLSLLDAAGEWFHDKTNNLLYLWCPENGDPNTQIVEAKKREFAFNLSGKSFITIKGFTLFACSITTDPESGGNNKGYDAIGNDYYPWRYAGFIAPSKNCIIEGITAKFLSHYTDCSGHFFLQWGQSSGIVMSGSDHIIRNSVIKYSAGNGITLLGQRCKALNNYISDVNYNSTDCSGINTGGSQAITQDHEIGYNTITRTGRSGITPRNLINSSKTNLVARIHHNDLSDFMLQDWDGGGIYTAGAGNFTRIDHNVIHDGMGYTVSGVYIDWGKNFVIDHNVIYNVEWGIHLQHNIDGTTTGLSNMICYNNTIIVKNTSASPYGPFGFGSSGAKNTQLGSICRNNINVYRNGTSSTKTAGYFPYTNAFDNAVKSNNLDHPADPKFTDYMNADLTLLGNSTAIDAGIAVDAISLDGYTIPAYNDTAIGIIDIGAYEYGRTKWTEGYTSELKAPTDLSATEITSTSFKLNWTLSSNNVGVVAYEAYNGETLLGTSSGTSSSMNITGLTAATNYQVTLTARDAAGNLSETSSPALSITTLITSLLIYDILEEIHIFTRDKIVVVDLTQLSGKSSVFIYDIHGSLLKMVKNNDSEELNLKVPSNGIYFVHVQNGSQSFVQKVAVF